MSPMSRDPVTITGAGVVTPLGVGVSRFWERLLEGYDACTPTPRSVFGCPVPEYTFSLEGVGFDIEDHADYRLVRRMPRFSQISLVAAQEAMASCGLPEGAERDEAGVVLGTAFSASEYHFEYFDGLFHEGLKEASPLLFSESVMNGASGHISHQLGLRGPGLTLLGSEDVGMHALATSLDQLRLGDVPCVLAGGADEYCDVHQTSLASYDVIGDAGARPFQRGSMAPPIGEGACFLILESLEHSNARGAKVLARVLGSSYGRRLPGDEPGAAVAQAIRGALSDSDIAASDVDLVVSGAGGGTLDAVELAGLEAVFGSTQNLLITAPKRYFGEAFGLSSAAQVLVGALAITHGNVPGSGDHRADMLPDAWRLPAKAESFAGDRALVVSATLEGGATAVVVGR